MSNTISRRAFTVAGLGVAGALAFGSHIALADAPAEGDQAAEGGLTEVNAELIDNDLVIDVTEVPAGPVKFNITNLSSPAITEFELIYNLRIMGEKENLAPGLPTVSFTKTLNGGDYQLYIPGANTEYVDFKVVGEVVLPEGSTQDILAQGVQLYAEYVADQIQNQYDYCVELQAAVNSGDLEAAKEAYVKARPFYERAESAVEGFLMPGTTDVEDNANSLDYMIDMRASSLDEEVGWHGFHAIERHLWGNAAAIDEEAELAEEDPETYVEDEVIEAGITEETIALVDELVLNVQILNEDVIPTFADDLLPEDLANGAADLLEECATGKIVGEEERYSKIDLLDFRANVEGAEQAYASLRDGLLEIDEDLVARVDEEFAALIALLDGYRDENYLGGYVPYTAEIRERDGQKLADALLPLHEDIASLAEKVATA